MAKTMSKKWADGPIELIKTPRQKAKEMGKEEPAAWEAATEMAQVHNAFLRALNAIVQQAANVREPSDVADFMVFCKATCDAIDEHHKTEETFMFPLFEQHAKEGVMEENLEQHELLHPLLHALDVYVNQVINGVAEYDGQRLVKLVDDLAPIFSQHLREEVDRLCTLDRFDLPWPAILERVTAYAVKKADPEYALPFFQSNGDYGFEDGIHVGDWPPFPWIVYALIRWWHWGKHRAVWRFSSCDAAGRPQELPFASPL